MINWCDGISVELLLGWHKGIFGRTKEDIAGKLRDCVVHVGVILLLTGRMFVSLWMSFSCLLVKEG